MEGTLVAGRYRIMSPLGKGGMGTVWRARDEELRRYVALKVLHEGFSKAATDRFRREMDVCARLRHPHVIRLLDAGTLPSGELFCVVELLEGRGFDRLLKKQRRIFPDQLRELLHQIVDGVAFAHERGVIHRDLKPANVFVVPERGAVVMDFGLALAIDRTGLTKTGAYVGTPLYMSPEMLSGDTVDARSDLWQVGIMAYQALTGRHPFRGDGLEAIAAAIVTTDPAPPSSLVDNLPPDWDVFVARCLAKDPQARYADGAELIADLKRLGRGLPLAPFERPTRPEKVGRGRVPKRSVVNERRMPSAGFRFLLLVMVTVTLAGGTWLVWRRSDSPSEVIVSSVIIEEGWRRVRLRWTSDLPYLSHVEVVSPMNTSVHSSHPATTNHSVEVAGFEPGESFAFRLVLPSGASGFVQRGRTGTPRLTPLRGRVESQIVEVICQGSTIRRVSPIFGGETADEGTRRVFIESMAHGDSEAGEEKWRIRVDVDDPRAIRDLVIEMESPLAERLERSFAKALEHTMSSQLSVLRTYDPAAAAHAMREGRSHQIYDAIRALDPDDAYRERRRRAIEAQEQALFDHVRRGGVLERYRRATELSPLVFLTGFLDEEFRREAAPVLDKMLRLELHARLARVETALAPPLQLGDYGSSTRRPFEPTTVLEVRSGETPLQLGQPVFGPPDSVSAWEGSVQIPAAWDGSRAALEVQVDRMIRSVLRVRIGSLPPRLVHDLPSHDPDVVKTARTVYVGIPPGVLRRGVTRVELRHHRLFDTVDERPIVVGAVRLLLPERS